MATNLGTLKKGDWANVGRISFGNQVILIQVAEEHEKENYLALMTLYRDSYRHLVDHK